MNKSLIIFFSLASALISGCGGVYQITHVGINSASKLSFESSERECNSKNLFVFANADDPKQTIYISEKFRDCMASKGWKYSLIERKFWLGKSM